MKSFTYNKQNLLVSCAVEYTFLAIMLCSIDITSGLVITCLASVAHLLVTLFAGMHRGQARFLAWFGMSMIVDFVLIAGGLFVYFALLGMNLGDSSLIVKITKLSLLNSSGLGVVRGLVLVCIRCYGPN